MLNMDMRDLFPQLVGGDESRFLREYWRKRTLFTTAAVPDLCKFYDHDGFLEDYRRADFHGATLVIGVDDQRHRVMLRPGNGEVVNQALTQGLSVVLQALLLPEDLKELPEHWLWFLKLYDGFCSHLLPGFPSRVQPGGAVAAVDFFCTSSETSTGGHYDTGDVFYFVLEGEKEWTVEMVPDKEEGHRLTAKGENYTMDRPSLKEHMIVRVGPGDCLYVPPYTYHRVRSTGRSLAVSVGLPTFTEVTLLRAELSRVQTEQMIYDPLPSFPQSEDELCRAAQQEVRERVRGILDPLIAKRWPVFSCSTEMASSVAAT